MANHGRPLWTELMTTDPDAAQAFYAEVIGWKPTPWGDGSMHYVVFLQGDAPVAGLMALPQEAAAGGAPPHWLGYIGTDDVGATARRCVELRGAALQDPFTVPGVGEMAVLRDPQGAVFAVFRPEPTPEGHDDVEPAPEPGRFSRDELATRDWEAARTFYQALFGWTEASAMDMGPMGTYWMWNAQGRTRGGMFNQPADIPTPPHWLHYIEVADVDAAVARVQELGGRLLHGPMDVPGGDRVAQCMDPQGAVFGMHSRGDA